MAGDQNSECSTVVDRDLLVRVPIVGAEVDAANLVTTERETILLWLMQSVAMQLCMLIQCLWGPSTHYD